MSENIEPRLRYYVKKVPDRSSKEYCMLNNILFWNSVNCWWSPNIQVTFIDFIWVIARIYSSRIENKNINCHCQGFLVKVIKRTTYMCLASSNNISLTIYFIHDKKWTKAFSQIQIWYEIIWPLNLLTRDSWLSCFRLRSVRLFYNLFFGSFSLQNTSHFMPIYSGIFT